MECSGLPSAGAGHEGPVAAPDVVARAQTQPRRRRGQRGTHRPAGAAEPAQEGVAADDTHPPPRRHRHRHGHR